MGVSEREKTLIGMVVEDNPGRTPAILKLYGARTEVETMDQHPSAIQKHIYDAIGSTTLEQVVENQHMTIKPKKVSAIYKAGIYAGEYTRGVGRMFKPIILPLLPAKLQERIDGPFREGTKRCVYNWISVAHDTAAGGGIGYAIQAYFDIPSDISQGPTVWLIGMLSGCAISAFGRLMKFPYNTRGTLGSLTGEGVYAVGSLIGNSFKGVNQRARERIENKENLLNGQEHKQLPGK